MLKSKVAVIKTSPERVLTDLEKLLKMADIEAALPKSSPTILKDNISWHFPMPGANSTPWQLEGTIAALRGMGYDSITAVENKTVVTRPVYGEKLNKFDRVFRKYSIPVKYNFESRDMAWTEFKPRKAMRVLDKIYPHGIHIPDFFVGRNIIHFPTMKCHIYTTTTGAMKNAFGGLLSTRRHYTHTWIHETLVDLLAIQKEIHSGLFAVMDATTAGNGPGPRTLKPVRADYILASSDQVAIDALSAKMMGFDPLSIPYIRMATEDGLGNGDPRRIEIVGDDVSGVDFRFKVGDNFASLFGDLFWFSPLKKLQNIFFRTPLVNLFVIASDFYHDKFWWNFKGKKILKNWKTESPWGRLWETY